MKLSLLLPNGTYRSEHCANDIEVSGICENTGALRRETLFIALRGEHFDPLILIDKIERAGVSAILLEEGHPLPRKTSLPCFYVKCIREATAYAFSHLYGSPEKSLCFIGVTGTNGKTTTASLIAHALSHSGIRAAYIGTLGVTYEKKTKKEGCMTTPEPRELYKTLAELLKEGCTHVVMEVSSHALLQHRVDPISFALAIFTNLSEDHLDYHETMEKYFEAKALLFKKAKLSLINVDDEHGRRLLSSPSGKALSYGIIQKADYTLTDLNESGMGGAQYTCLFPQGALPLQTTLYGSFNLYNSLSAVAAALLVGLTPTEVKEAMACAPCVRGRFEILDLSGFSVPFRVVIDYAHTPDAIAACLRSARRITSGRIIVVFGAGGEREREKRSKMGALVERYADFAFVSADNSRSESLGSIIEDILCGMPKKEKRRVVSNRKEAIRSALLAARTGDTVLLLGKGHEDYMIDARGSHYFSEREIVYSFFEARQE